MMFSTLSVRGQRNASAAAYMKQYHDVLGNLYDKDHNPKGIINLASAENFTMHEELAEYINKNFRINAHMCTYGEGAIGSSRLRRAMAVHINDYFKPIQPVLREQITFSSGVTAINEMYGWSIGDEGDGILLSSPIYGAFENDLTTKARLATIYVPSNGIDPLSPEYVVNYEASLAKAQAAGIKVRALLITNPHNPLGRCYSEAALRSLMVFCQMHQIHLISDEIYALSLFDAGNHDALPFKSILSIDTSGLIDAKLVHILYGMSKDFGGGGLRIGCFITRNEELNEAMLAISRFHWPSGLSVEVATTILEDRSFVEQYQRTSQLRLAENYKLATHMLNDAGIDYHRGGNAGFFLWIDFSPYLLVSTPEDISPEAHLASLFLDAGVCVATGEEFHSERPGWFRIVFTQVQEELVEGLKRVIDVAKNTR